MAAWLKALLYALFLIVCCVLNVRAWQLSEDEENKNKPSEWILIWLSALGGAFGSLIARLMFKGKKHGNLIVDIVAACVEVVAIILICVLA